VTYDGLSVPLNVFVEHGLARFTQGDVMMQRLPGFALTNYTFQECRWSAVFHAEEFQKTRSFQLLVQRCNFVITRISYNFWMCNRVELFIWKVSC
jgi:hypothetical protein